MTRSSAAIFATSDDVKLMYPPQRASGLLRLAKAENVAIDIFNIEVDACLHRASTDTAADSEMGRAMKAQVKRYVLCFELLPERV